MQYRQYTELHVGEMSMQYRQYRTTCGGRLVDAIQTYRTTCGGEVDAIQTIQNYMWERSRCNTDNTELHVGERSMQYRQYRTTRGGEVDAIQTIQNYMWGRGRCKMADIKKQNSFVCCSTFEHLLGGKENECLNN